MMKNMTVVLAQAACVTAMSLGAATFDLEFAKGLLSIPSESRSISECNRAVAYMNDYFDRHGAHQPDEHGSVSSAEEYLNFFIAWPQAPRAEGKAAR